MIGRVRQQWWQFRRRIKSHRSYKKQFKEAKYLQDERNRFQQQNPDDSISKQEGYETKSKKKRSKKNI